MQTGCRFEWEDGRVAVVVAREGEAGVVLVEMECFDESGKRVPDSCHQYELTSWAEFDASMEAARTELVGEPKVVDVWQTEDETLDMPLTEM
jgi:hypothetical protein